ncbi:MAG: DUF2029 domain-containing protein [Planctomycetes bacterium]|nr:DUF2029 domain-containing protein [Planctomycetota bacterium]
MATLYRLRAWGLWLAVAAAVVVLVHALGVSWNDVNQDGGLDLRAKVVAARQVMAGYDPYFYRTGPTTPELWLDPMATSGHARVTMTPAGIALYMPFAGLPYRTQRQIWFALEWAALLGAIALLAFTMRSARGRAIFLAVALLLFAGGYFWRVHVERGQYYSFVLLLLAAGAWLATRRPAWRWTAGLLWGSAIALRPTFLVLPALLFVMHRRKEAVAAGIGLVLAIVVTLPATGTTIWEDYFLAMRVHERGHTHPYWPGDSYELKTVVEGMDMRQLIEDRSKDVALLNILSWDTDLAFITDRRESLGLFCRGLALAWSLTFLAYLQFRARPLQRMQYALAAGSILVLGIDYLVPSRWGYTDVLFLLPMALLLPLLLRRNTRPWPLVLVTAGLLAGYALNSSQGTLLRSLLVMAGFHGALLCMLLRARARKPR